MSDPAPATLFVRLNRLLRFLVVAALAAGAWWVWSERERALPWVDEYRSWTESEYRRPAPLPRRDGVVVKVLSPETLQLRDPEKIVWNFGVAGLERLGPQTASSKPSELQKETLSILTQWTDRTVSVAYTASTPLHTGLGFFYSGTNEPLHLQLIRTGWYRIKPEVRRLLPLEEQVALRAAEREARKMRRGGWAAEAGGGG